MVTVSHVVFITPQILSTVYNLTINTKPRFSLDYHGKKGRAGDILQRLKLRPREVQRPRAGTRARAWR